MEVNDEDVNEKVAVGGALERSAAIAEELPAHSTTGPLEELRHPTSLNMTYQLSTRRAECNLLSKD